MTFVLLVVAAATLVGWWAEWRGWPSADDLSISRWDGPDDRVEEFWGPFHCEWDQVRMLAVPVDVLGAGVRDSVPTHLTYVNDPDQDLPLGSVHGSVTRLSRLPEGSRPTGYSRGERELWLEPGGITSSVLLVSGNRIERWPQSTAGCD